MYIFLIAYGTEKEIKPLEHLGRCLADHERSAVGVVVESEAASSPVGTVVLKGSAAHPGVEAALEEATRSGRTGWFEATAPRWRLFALPLSLPPKVLLLGA